MTTPGPDNRVVLASGQFDYHPYECGGAAFDCPHCLRAVTDTHSPYGCGLCEADVVESEANEAAHRLLRLSRGWAP